jgi:hypothetical protein
MANCILLFICDDVGLTKLDIPTFLPQFIILKQCCHVRAVVPGVPAVKSCKSKGSGGNFIADSNQTAHSNI